MSIFKKLFGTKPIVDYPALMAEGAKIIDVRTPAEFQSGHIKGSRNIPLDKLERSLSKVSRSTVVITCCASGVRSANAKRIFEKAGFEQVHNGGGWRSLQRKLES